MTDNDLAARIGALFQFLADHAAAIPPHRRVQAVDLIERITDLVPAPLTVAEIRANSRPLLEVEGATPIAARQPTNSRPLVETRRPIRENHQ